MTVSVNSGTDGVNNVATSTDSGGNTILIDGTTGLPLGVPRRIFSSGIPSGIPSSGSIGNNGALTLGTPFANVYGPSNGNIPGIWLSFPAGAVYAGSLVGSYWTVMSSTSAGTVYNNLLTAGSLSPPTNPTPIVATGPGAYTQNVGFGNVVPLVLGTLPANALGPNGFLQVFAKAAMSNTANNKVFYYSFGNTTAMAGVPFINVKSVLLTYTVANMGVPGRQSIIDSFPYIGSAYDFIFSVDTTVQQNVGFYGFLAAATDYLLINNCQITVTYSN